MSQPRTFHQIVGAPEHPSPLDSSALVLIDIQREYVDGAVPLENVHKAAEECAIEIIARRQVDRYGTIIGSKGLCGKLLHGSTLSTCATTEHNDDITCLNPTDQKIRIRIVGHLPCSLSQPIYCARWTKQALNRYAKSGDESPHPRVSG